MDCRLLGFFWVQELSQARILEGVGPFPTSGDLLDPGIEPASLASPSLMEGSFTTALESPINS